MKRNNVNKKFIKDKINFDLGLPGTFSDKVLNSFFDIIIEGLINDGVVKISNFGKFKVLNKRSRVGRNPKTNETFEITARKVVAFYPSKAIKKKFNEKEELSSV